MTVAITAANFYVTEEIAKNGLLFSLHDSSSSNNNYSENSP